jgi:hypothetical protein
MPFSEGTRNLMLDVFVPDLMSLHSGDPGPLGTANELAGGGYARQACVFDAASGGARALNADVNFSATALTSITHFGVWTNAGTVFRSGSALTGDQAANADGEYRVEAVGTSLTVT